MSRERRALALLCYFWQIVQRFWKRDAIFHKNQYHQNMFNYSNQLTLFPDLTLTLNSPTAVLEVMAKLHMACKARNV